MATKGQEEAVRSYLLALKDPAALHDDAQLKTLRDRLEASADPLERVRLQEQLKQAKHVDAATFEEAFVKHAKSWAQDQGISAESLLAEGADPTVLRKAGFDVRGKGGRRTARKRAASRRVSAQEVRQAIPRGKFTISDLAEAAKASTATVRNVVNDMLSEGKLEEVGTDEGHQGPGRAPKKYRRKGKG